MSDTRKRCFRFLLILLGLRAALPLLLPFLLGTLLALGADPAADFLCRKGRLPRSLAAGLAVSGEIAGLGMLGLLLAGLAVSQMGRLTQALPKILSTAQTGFSLLEARLLQWSDLLPEGLENGYRQALRELFSGGADLLARLSALALGTAGAFLSRLPGQALTFGTTLLSGFMICAKLPAIRKHLSREDQRLASLAQGLRKVKAAGKLWLRSQLKLMGVTFCILFSGFSLLRMDLPLLAALAVTLVDALPVFGTGTVLLPWALLSAVNNAGGKALGLVGLYACAALTRSVLEPKLVGSHLGLDPLVTLIAMYCGLRLWGLPGMLLTPLLAAAVFCVFPEEGEGR